MPHKATATKRPDTKHPDGSEREDKADRQWLAEITDETGAVVDSAYFPTKASAAQWARDLYKQEIP